MRKVFALLVAGAAAAAGCSAPTSADLVSQEDAIKFLVVKDTAPADWTTPAFDDSAWKGASGAIGPLQPDGDGVMPAVLARSSFDLGAQAASYKSVTLKLDLDASYTAYVNGTAMVTAPDGKTATLDLPAGLVHESGNTLAVEVHPPTTMTTVALAPVLDGSVDPAANSKPRIVRGPYLIGPRPDGIDIEWETNVPTASTAVVDGQSVDGGNGTHHSAVLTGLQPSRSYPYHIEIEGQQSPDSDFVTAPANAGERVRFVVYGDNRTNGDAHRMIAQHIDAEGPDFLVNTGDLVDASSAKEWQYFFDIEYDLLRHVPIYPSLGNHEANSGGSGRFAELFPLGNKDVFGGRVYSADFGGVHIAVLDSNGDLAAQARWLEQDLTAAEAHGAKHEFIVMHHGPFSGSRLLLHGSNEDAQEHIVPIAHAHHVDAMLGGHDHFYERGADGDLPYFVSGGGGAPLRNCGAIAQTIVAWSQYHYIVVDVEGPTVNFTARDSSGNTFDQLTITK